MSTPINDYIEQVHEIMNRKSIEPTPRLHGGRFGFARHRFPIKDGISLTDVMVMNLERPNALLERLRDNQK